MRDNDGKLNRKWAAFISIVLIVGMLIAGRYARQPWDWVIVGVLIVLFMIVLGLSISGRPAGMLINERFRMSLSRFQLVLWTVIVLSAFLAIALKRIGLPGIDALAIAIDSRIWALLGISVTSLVGTPLIQTLKADKSPDPDKLQRMGIGKQLGIADDESLPPHVGILATNRDKSEASFVNIFQGDELGNKNIIDMTKLQMFLFTIIAALSYAALLFEQIGGTSPADLNSFPPLSEGLIAVLGISHAGYLTGKAVDHTPTLSRFSHNAQRRRRSVDRSTYEDIVV